jgi:hypothetical protein
MAARGETARPCHASLSLSDAVTGETGSPKAVRDDPARQGQVPLSFMGSPLSKRRAPKDLVDAPLSEKGAPEDLVDAPLSEKGAPEDLVDAPLSERDAREDLVDAPKGEARVAPAPSERSSRARRRAGCTVVTIGRVAGVAVSMVWARVTAAQTPPTVASPTPPPGPTSPALPPLPPPDEASSPALPRARP